MALSLRKQNPVKKPAPAPVDKRGGYPAVPGNRFSIPAAARRGPVH